MKSKKSYKIVFFFFSVLIAVSACKKDKPILNFGGECQDFIDDLPILTFSEDRIQYKAPCFNPNNANEIVYYYQDNELGVFQLQKYNFSTKQKTVLVDNTTIWGQPKWSKKGWIAFGRTRGYVEHIFAIKDNGDSLIQISSAKANLGPFWSDEGDELYWTHSPDLGSQWYLLSQKLNQSDSETLSLNVGAGPGVTDLVKKKVLRKKNINGIPYYGYFDLSLLPLKETDFVKISNLFGGTSGITWHPSGLFFYVSHSNGNGRGLYKINLDGTTQHLINHCDSKYYTIIDCSPDGNYLIAERVDSRQAKNSEGNLTGETIQKSSIYLIDTKTLIEFKLDL